jgi:16S rRNA processing protein RimM
MGRVAGPYGVRGWVKVAPEGGAQAALAQAKEWWIGAEPYSVTQAKIHSATVVGKLAGVDSRERVLGLKGKAVAVRREALPEPGEGRYYLADLVGVEVLNERGETLGVVKQVFWNGAQDVIEVAGDRTRLIPWVASVVTEVDLPKRRIRVEWEADW